MTEAEMLAFTFGPLPPESEPQHSYSETQSAPSQGGPDHTHASMTHSEQMTEHETLDKGHQQALQPEVHTSSPAAPSTSAAEVEPLRAEQQSASIIAPPASVTPAAAAAVAAAAGPSTHPSNNNNRWPDNEDDSDEDDDGMDLDEELRQYMALKESMEEEEVAAPPSRQGPQPTTATAHPSSQTHPASTTTSSRAASNPTQQQQQQQQQRHQTFTASPPDDMDDDDGDRELEELLQMQRDDALAQQQQQQQQQRSGPSTASLSRPSVELPDPKRPKFDAQARQHKAAAAAAGGGGGGGGNKGAHKEGYESQFDTGEGGGDTDAAKRALQAVTAAAVAAAAAAAAASQELRLRCGAAAVAAAAAAALKASFQAPRRMAGDIRGACISVTRVNGERVYCAMAAASASSALRAVAGGSSSGAAAGAGAGVRKGQLLGRSVAEMMQVHDDRRLSAIMEESARLHKALTGGGDDSDGGTEGGRAAGRRGGGADADQLPQSSCGWTSTPPRHFMDLLSDERTNREVVKWVKAWDATVFGSRGAARSTAAVSAGGTRGAAADPGSRAGREPHPNPNPGSRVPVKAWGGPAKAGGGARGAGGGPPGGFDGGKGARERAAMLSRAIQGGGPQDSRPTEKIVLIAGPPGLGKTTLAHVVAAHCGYHPYEINASDDRTAAALTLKVSDAVHFQSVLGQRRPNCVIIDEIDGATGGHEAGGAVAALLKIAMAAGGGGGGGGGGGKGAADADEDTPSPKKPARPTSTRDAAASGTTTTATTTTTITRKRGPKRALAPLVRPIICICNDLFVPALRPLREVAKVLVFPAPAADKLVARLRVVCELEGIKVDKMALTLLAERTDCDIRSALNTLQFLSRRCPHIHAHNIEGLNIGTKDSSKSAFDIWSAVLWARAKVRRAFGGGAGSAGSGSGLKPGSSAGCSKLDAVCGMMADFGDYETVMGGLHENMLSQRYLDIDFRKTCAMVDAIGSVDIMMRSCRRSSDFGLMRYFAPSLYIIHALAAQDEKPHLAWPKPAAEAHRRQAANAELLRGWAATVAPAVLQACGTRTMCLSALLHKTACTMVDYSLKYDFADHDPTASPLHPGRPQGGLNGLRGAPPPAPRPLPLLPAIDTLHCFLKRGQTTLLSAAAGTAHTPPPVHGSRGGSGSSGSGSVPLAVRQMISRQATIETIHRAERVQDQLRAMALERQSRFEQHHDTSQPMDEAIANTHDISKFGKKRAVSSKAGVEVKAPTASAAESPSPGPGSTQRPTTSMWKPTPAPAPTPKPAHHKGSSNSKAPKQNWLELIQSAGVKKRKQIARAATGTGPGMEPLQRAATPSAAAVAGGSTAVPGVGASEPVVEDSEGGAKGQFAILYHYNEGYTNAVKRPLMMKELL
ncbi:MAG: hypothetical protein WDW36_008463 [Sanguina aurantia]